MELGDQFGLQALEEDPKAPWSFTKLQPLATALQTAHETASRGIRLRVGDANTCRYGNASVHFAVLLNQALDNSVELQTAIEAVVTDFARAEVDKTCALASRFVKSLPQIVWAPYTTGTTGVPDIVSIMCAVAFGSPGINNFDTYYKAFRRLQSVLIIAHHQWLLNKEFKGGDDDDRLISARDAVLEELDRCSYPGGTQLESDTAVPTSLWENAEMTLSDMMPTPAAAIARAGPRSGKNFSTAVAKLKPLVTAVHEGLVKRVTASGAADESDFGGIGAFALLAHMRVFLYNVHDQLAFTMVRCDRVPALGPWYALIIMGVRAYAMTVAAVVIDGGSKTTNVVDDVSATYWLLRVIACRSEATRWAMASPLENLMSPPTCSMYERMGCQDGAYWVLLRAALSGLEFEKALAVGSMILQYHGNNQGTLARFAVTCLLMHTQTGMVILLMDKNQTNTMVPLHDEDGSLTKKQSAMFSVIKYLVLPFSNTGLGDGVSDRSIFDLITCKTSGTLDLEFLASDQAIFVDDEPVAAAWRSENMIRTGSEGDAIAAWNVASTHAPIPKDAQLELRFVRQFALVAASWIAVIETPGTTVWTAWDRSSTDAGFSFVQAKQGTQGMEYRLKCLAAGHVSLHCGVWLELCFATAERLERHRLKQSYAKHGHRLFVIRPPPSVLSGGEQTVHAVRDAAWLTMNIRKEMEKVLRVAHFNGYLRAGNNVVLVGWFWTQSSGVMVFARTLTAQTVYNATVSKNVMMPRALGWLMSEDKLAMINDRGEDSILITGLEYAEALTQSLETQFGDTLRQQKEIGAELSTGAPIDLEAEMRERASETYAEMSFGQVAVPESSAAEQRDAEATMSDIRKRMSEMAASTAMEESAKKMLPEIPASARKRREVAMVVEGAMRWTCSPMDAPTHLAMSGWMAALDNAAMHANMHVTQTEFRNGCSTAVLSYPATVDDIQSPALQQAANSVGGYEAEKWMQSERRLKQYVSAKLFQRPEKRVRDLDRYARYSQFPPPRGITKEQIEAHWKVLTKNGEVTDVSRARLAAALTQGGWTKPPSEEVRGLRELFGLDTSALGAKLENKDDYLRSFFENLLVALDTNNDKRISREEFVSWIVSDTPEEATIGADPLPPEDLAIWNAFTEARRAVSQMSEGTVV